MLHDLQWKYFFGANQYCKEVCLLLSFIQFCIFSTFYNEEQFTDVKETTFNITWIMVLFIFLYFCMKLSSDWIFFLLSVCYMTRKCYIRLMHYRRQWLILARIYFSFQPKTLFDCFSNVTQNCKQTSNHLDKKCIMCRQAIAITTINKEERKIWISNFLEKWCWITVSFNKLFLCIICVKAPYDSFGKKWEMKLI